MAQQSAEQIIPLDFAEAFADAVLVYEIWNPEYPERLIRTNYFTCKDGRCHCADGPALWVNTHRPSLAHISRSSRTFR